MENFNTEKIYFVPGDLVTIKHDIGDKPIMLVKAKETKLIKNEDTFKGMRCVWFSKNFELQEAIFSTKDLQHVATKR